MVAAGEMESGRLSRLPMYICQSSLGFHGGTSSSGDAFAPGAVDGTLVSVHHRYPVTQAALISLNSRSEVAQLAKCT